MLFGGNASGANPVGAKEPMFKPVAGGTFGGVKLPETPTKVAEDKKQPAATTTSLFGGVTPAAQGGSLFGNLNTVKSE